MMLFRVSYKFARYIFLFRKLQHDLHELTKRVTVYIFYNEIILFSYLQICQQIYDDFYLNEKFRIFNINIFKYF